MAIAKDSWYKISYVSNQVEKSRFKGRDFSGVDKA